MKKETINGVIVIKISILWIFVLAIILTFIIAFFKNYIFATNIEKEETLNIERNENEVDILSLMLENNFDTYNAIVDKFLIPLTSKDKYIIVQPTTYSDKTKFVNYMISTVFNGKDLSRMSNSELESLYINSIGKGYQTILQNVLDDFAQIFDLQEQYKQAYTIDEFGNVTSTNDLALRQLVTTVDRRLNNITEQELVALAR